MHATLCSNISSMYILPRNHQIKHVFCAAVFLNDNQIQVIQLHQKSIICFLKPTEQENLKTTEKYKYLLHNSSIIVILKKNKTCGTCKHCKIYKISN